jgi:hypothetical protein
MIIRGTLHSIVMRYVKGARNAMAFLTLNQCVPDGARKMASDGGFSGWLLWPLACHKLARVDSGEPAARPRKLLISGPNSAPAS